MGGQASKEDRTKPVVTIAYFGVEWDVIEEGLAQIRKEYHAQPNHGVLTPLPQHGVGLNVYSWEGYTGRMILRPLVSQYFSSTYVLVLGLSANKEASLETYMKQEIYNLVSDPRLSDVTVLAVVMTSDVHGSGETLSANDMEQEFQNNSLMSPNQTWHFMESPTLGTEVMEESLRLVKLREKDTKTTTEEKLSHQPSSGGKKVGKLRHKFINFWKSALTH